MKINLKIILVVLLSLNINTFALENALSASDKAAKFSLIKNALRTKIAIDSMAKSYLYVGEKIGTRQASKEKLKSVKKFNTNFNVLLTSFNDKKTKNLLVYMQFSYDELIETMKSEYSLENAQVVLDLSTSIGEGAEYIANRLRDEIGKDPIVFDGLVPNIETIAKFYIAYTAGIKDENTIALMRESIESVAKQIERRVQYNKNTVRMNKNINQAKQLWDIVYSFYLDIDNNGLPFIVLKTTTDLKKVCVKYNKDYIKRRTQELKEGK